VRVTYGDAMPWGALRWRVDLTADGCDVSLSRLEFEMVCAAVEYDRCHGLALVADAQRRARSARGSYDRAFWDGLMDGAVGLRFANAAGEMHLREIFARLDCRAQWRYEHTPDPNVARAREALGRLRSV